MGILCGVRRVLWRHERIRHPKPRGATNAVDIPSREEPTLNEDLKNVLSTCLKDPGLRASTLEKALDWCQFHKFDSIDKMIQAQRESDFIAELHLKGAKEQLLRKALRDWRGSKSEPQQREKHVLIL